MSEQVFTQIFNDNVWNSPESVSGIGSELGNTRSLRCSLRFLIEELKIESIMDAACGDMNWMKEVNLENVKYEGWDIVKEIISINEWKFSSQTNYKFYNKDSKKDDMPKVDLVIARDLIIHFSISEIWSFLNNVVKSNSKYLLITRHDTNNVNEEIHAGQYRPVNLENPPFSFNKALLYIKEDEAFKFMSLYKIDDLRAIL